MSKNLSDNLISIIPVKVSTIKGKTDLYKLSKNNLTYVPKNTSSNIDYKAAIEDQFPWLPKKAFDMIAANLDEAYEKSVKFSCPAYYESYGLFIYNRLDEVNNTILAKSFEQCNVYDVVKNKKALLRLNEYMSLTKCDVDVKAPELGEYTSEGIKEIEKQNKTVKKVKTSLIATLILLMIVCAGVYSFSDYNFIIPLAACIITSICLYFMNLTASKLEARISEFEEADNKVKFPYISKLVIASKYFFPGILTDEQFVGFVSNKTPMGVYLLDMLVYIIYNCLDEEGQEELYELVESDAYQDEITEDIESYRTKYQKLVSINASQFSTAKTIEDINKGYRKSNMLISTLSIIGMVTMVCAIIIML